MDTLNKLKIINFNMLNILEWLRVLTEKKLVKLGLKCSNFQSLKYQVRFARIARSNQSYTNAVSCRKKDFHKLSGGKMYPAALHKIPTQTVDLSQVLAKCESQKQPQINKSNTKNWDKKQVKS